MYSKKVFTSLYKIALHYCTYSSTNMLQTKKTERKNEIREKNNEMFHLFTYF